MLGFGTVGAGVVEGLQRNGDLIAKRLGVNLSLRRVADLDLQRDRGVAVDPALLTQDAEAVIRDPDVDLVVELIGGTHAARDLVLQALRMGKPVVTANKALLAEAGEELYRAAEESKTDLFFEASVAGGLPIIKALREGLIANHIEGITGILNGTCNYILTCMERREQDFFAALQAAQQAGYAEAEPSLDIDGIDTAHKAVILASLAYGMPVPMSSVHIEGLRGISRIDLEYARELGCRIKLLAVIKHVAGDVEVRVHPALVPLDSILASVGGVYNAVAVKGDLSGTTFYIGRGAGRAATSSAVLADLADAARNLMASAKHRVPAFVRHSHYRRVRPIEEIETRYYLRLTLLNQPGMLARVAHILGEHQISIASMIQKGQAHGDAHAAVILTTERAREGRMRSALEQIDALDVVGAETVMLRIEDEIVSGGPSGLPNGAVVK